MITHVEFPRDQCEVMFIFWGVITMVSFYLVRVLLNLVIRTMPPPPPPPATTIMPPPTFTPLLHAPVARL